MPQTRLGRRGAALGLLIGTSLSALIGCQAIAARPATTMVDTNPAPAFRSLAPALAPSPFMAAAAPTGQFEDLFTPPAPKIVTPAAAPAAPAPAPVEDKKPEPVVYERGIASTYGEGDGFEGNRTACGQVFHTAIVQIAHKTLPCGTVVKVEDTGTGRSIVAEVTDRGPYVKGRVVDLSWGAFKQLHPTGPDLLSVNVYVLDGENN